MNHEAEGISRRRRRGRISGAHRRELLAVLLVWLGLAASAMALGAQHPMVLAICMASVVAGGLVLSWFRSMRPVPPPVFGLAALASYTLFQALPLPRAFVATLAPANAAVWDRALSPLREAGPSWFSISLDPGATRIEAFKWLSYAAVFWTSVELGRMRRGPLLLAGVFVSAIAIAVTTLVHGLIDATRVFGLYAPLATPMPWHLGPLLNPNNFAGYLNLGAFCGFGLLASERSPIPQWLATLGVAMLLACSALSGSRGGLVSLVLGMSALALLLWLGYRERRHSARGRIWSLCAIVGGLALAAISFQSSAWHELAERDLSKLKMVVWAKPMLLSHFWLGVGRGAFESTFPAYHAAPENLRWQYAENFPVQWATEWGVPSALVAATTLGWSMLPARLGLRRSRLAMAGWIGVVVLLVQNFADLGIEIPALSMAMFAVLGALWGDREYRSGSHDVSDHSAPVLWFRLGAAAPLVLVAAPAIAAGFHSDSRERARLHDELPAKKIRAAGVVDAFHHELRAAMLRHPAEPYFPLLGGMTALSSDARDPLPWLARALERAPGSGQAHLLLAETLARRGARGQALLELRLATEAYGPLTPLAARAALRYAEKPSQLQAAVPPGRVGTLMLAELASALPADAQQARREFLIEAIRRDGTQSRPRVLLIQDMLRDLQANPDDGVRRNAVEAELSKLRALLPYNSAPMTLQADYLVAIGNAAEAERFLATACNRVEDRFNCLASRATIAARIPDSTTFAEAAHDLSAAACASPPECASTSTRLAELHASRREWGLALNQALRACQAEPSEAEHWLLAAKFAKAAGLSTEANEALRHARELGIASGEQRL